MMPKLYDWTYEWHYEGSGKGQNHFSAANTRSKGQSAVSIIMAENRENWHINRGTLIRNLPNGPPN